jgi:hypothetical protein
MGGGGVQGLENLAEHLRSAYAGKSYLEVLREYPEGARKLYHRYFAVVCPLKNLSFGSAIEAWDALSFDTVFKSYAEWKEFLLHKQKLKGSISKASLSLTYHTITVHGLIASSPVLDATGRVANAMGLRRERGSAAERILDRRGVAQHHRFVRGVEVRERGTHLQVRGTSAFHARSLQVSTHDHQHTHTARARTHTHTARAYARTHTHLHAWTQQSTFTIDTSAFDYRWNTTNGDSASRTGDSPSVFLSSNVGGASSSVTSMFSTSYSWTSDYRGLYNQGATCYMNSLLQTLFMTPEFRRSLYLWKGGKGLTQEEEDDSIPLQLQRLFARLQFGEGSAVSTQALTKSFGWDSGQSFVQQDAQELCRVLFDVIEEHFAGTSEGTVLPQPSSTTNAKPSSSNRMRVLHFDSQNMSSRNCTKGG